MLIPHACYDIPLGYHYNASQLMKQNCLHACTAQLSAECVVCIPRDHDSGLTARITFGNSTAPLAQTC